MAKETPGKDVRNQNPHLNAAQDIQQILDAMPFYVLLVDSRHNILAASESVKVDFDLVPEQFVGTYCPLGVHNHELTIEQCPLMEACARGEIVEREILSPHNGQWMRLSVYPTSLVTNDGKPVFMHFAQEITGAKISAEEISRSLEHHSALCDLMQKLQYCQNSNQILNVLIDRIISLSWVGVTSTAIGFLVREQDLEMAAQRNLGPWQMKSCEYVAVGDCLCGKVAQTGEHLVCSSTGEDHTIQYEEMDEHWHVIMPISHEERVLGVLTLYLKSGDEVDDFRIDFLKAAAAAAGAALARQLSRDNAKRIREKAIAKVIFYMQEERKRIAQNLYDQVCRSLSTVLQEVQEYGSGHESLKGIRQNCETRIRNLIEEVQRKEAQLRPTTLDDFGLELALGNRLGEISTTRTELKINYEFVSSLPSEKRLPSPVEVGIFHVVMEALNNIITHASATRVNIVILWQPQKVRVLVDDDGCGFDYAAVRKDIDCCLGLIDMEERINLLGGTLSIESSPQKGTAVRAEIPLDIVH